MPELYKTKFSPFTNTLQWVSDLSWITKPMLFKGDITVNTDFPQLADIDNGWTYEIKADVTDNAASVYEIRDLTITHAASGSGTTVKVTVDGTEVSVTVVTPTDTINQVAAKIAATAFAGWTVTNPGAPSAVVRFTSTSYGERTSTYSLNGVSTAVTGTFAQVAAGKEYTGTGQLFMLGDEIAWNGTNWTILGSLEKMDVTYAELVALISASSLVPGRFYNITDYVTKHLIPNTSTINTGTAEPLIVLATSVNTIDKQVYSTIHPEDIIYYDVTNNLCEDSSTPRTGKITYREDTTYNLSTHYDFRNVKFRRWAVGCALWVNGAGYTYMDLVKSPIDSNIYVCKKTIVASVTDPSADATYFQLQFDIVTNAFISWTSVKGDFIAGDYDTTNLIINNTTPNVDYKDVSTFGTSCLNIKINKPITVNYNNIVFGINNTYISFEENNYDMTFGADNSSIIHGVGNSSIIYGIGNTRITYGIGNTCISYGSSNDDINYLGGNTRITYGNNNANIYFESDNCGLIIGGGNDSIHFENDVGNIVIGDSSRVLVFEVGIDGITLNSNATCNRFGHGTSFVGISFALATHVYAAYPCTITNNSAGVPLLLYYDAANNLVPVAVNS